MVENNLITNESTNLVEIENKNSNNYTWIEINSRMYAIDTHDVLEIIKVMEMDYSHQMPSYVLGIIDFDNKPIGVIDLREVFKKERITYGLSSKIVVLKIENNEIAIICDKVCDIKKIKKDKIQKVPFQQNGDFFDGVYVLDNENIYILNVRNILEYLNKNPQQYINQQNTIKYIVDDDSSKRVLAERKNFISNITVDIQTPTVLYDKGVTFNISGVKYYINMANVKEFYKVNNTKFTRVPNTEDYIYGLVNIKGEFITVLDLRRFFKNSKTQLKEKSTIIILNSEEYKLGILADEIGESIDVDFDEIIQNRLQNQDDNKMMEFVKDNEIYQVIDVEKLLQDERLTIV